MNALKKVADKISTPATNEHHEHHEHHDVSGACVTSSSSSSEVHIDKHIDAHAVHTGEIIEQRKVGEVEIVETVQQVKTVPVVETTRRVETLETGVAGLDIHSHHQHNLDVHAHKVELAHTHDSRTVVIEPVIEERLRKDVLVEVQPVIHKEVEKEVVHHVEKHITEAAAPSLAGKVTLQPVVQEHVHTHIIEEIHPVIHREIVLQQVERVEEHITEHIVAPTKHVHEVIVEKELLPVHTHDHHCHHEVATERLTNVIVPGAAVSTAATVTTREVLVDQAGPAVITSHHSEVVGDKHMISSVGTSKVVDVHTDTHLASAGALHTDRVVETHEYAIDGHHLKEHDHTHTHDHAHDHAHAHEHDHDHAEKHHHHLHLPHFLHSHKDTAATTNIKDEHVTVVQDTKMSATTGDFGTGTNKTEFAVAK